MLPEEAAEFRSHLLCPNVTSHAPHQVRSKAAVRVEARRGFPVAHRQPCVGTLRILKPLGCHADDHRVIPAKLECSTNDTGVAAELASPSLVAQDKDRGCAWRIILRLVQPAGGRCSENGEQVEDGGRRECDDSIAIAKYERGCSHRVNGCQAGQRMSFGSEPAHCRVGYVQAFAEVGAILRSEHHELILVAQRQRPKEHGVDHAVRGRHGPNA